MKPIESETTFIEAVFDATSLFCLLQEKRNVSVNIPPNSLYRINLFKVRQFYYSFTKVFALKTFGLASPVTFSFPIAPLLNALERE